VVESYQKSVVYSYQKRIRSWLAREFENSQEPFSQHNLEDWRARSVPLSTITPTTGS